MKVPIPLSAYSANSTSSAFLGGVVSPSPATTPPETVKASVPQGKEVYAAGLNLAVLVNSLYCLHGSPPAPSSWSFSIYLAI